MASASPSIAASSKRMKPTFNHDDDFVPLGDITADDQRQQQDCDKHHQHQHQHQHRPYDRRNAHDKPKSKHVLPGCEPWILVKTKLRRRFVHNLKTRESLWRIPDHVLPAVLEFEKWEELQKEKVDNARWAEEQLKQMRPQANNPSADPVAGSDHKAARRRSESLQREDEAAALAELAAQAEHNEDQDARDAVIAVQSAQRQPTGYDSDSSYEEVEVTDSEGEEGEEDANPDGEELTGARDQDLRADQQPDTGDDAGPVEFGEDDIAWQLAAMGEEYGLDAGEYGDEPEDGWEEGVEGLPLSEGDATLLFRDLLDDYHVSPFIPWDRVVSDESENSILNDDRYTVLPNMKARKNVFDAWAKDKAAQIHAERATMAKSDPKIPYLAFLQEHATPKLYWPEFKRKFKREAEMNDRKLGDKDREKLYRDHVARLKLPESTRKADLLTLLGKLPLKALNHNTSLETLPQQLLSNLHYISLPPAMRDPIIEAHRKKLAAAPEDDLSDEQRREEKKKRDEKRRREQAMAHREKQVDEQRRQAEKVEARAKRDLRDTERELERAMATGNRG